MLASNANVFQVDMIKPVLSTHFEILKNDEIATS